MPRARLISPEFWTSEAVVDCPPMTRLLLLGLSTFADDFGVLPLRPRTLRMQVFPGDAIDDEQMRAMIEELAARGLVRRYTVEDVEYLSIVDWAVHQRVGKRARRRYPGLGGERAGTGEGSMETTSSLDHREPLQSPSCASAAPPADDPPATASDEAADAAWRDAVTSMIRRSWGADVPDDIAQHAARWRAQGHDLARDVLPAIERVINVAVECDKPLILEWVDRAMVRRSPPAHVA